MGLKKEKSKNIGIYSITIEIKSGSGRWEMWVFHHSCVFSGATFLPKQSIHSN